MKRLWITAGMVAFWLTWPALWLYLHNTKRTRVIVKAGDKVLLVKVWLGAGQWILPGGGIHRGEDPIVAAVREVHEETGVAVDPAALKALDVMNVKEYGFSFSCLVYVAELNKPTAVRAQPLEVSQVEWLDKKTLGSVSPLTAELLSRV